MQSPAQLQESLREPRALLAVGAYDAFSALLVERSGADIVYLSGLMASASYLGLPDLGLITASERIALAGNIAPRLSCPVIADADQGYGNELNVMNTIERFRAAGVAGVHLDDEVFPGKCQTLEAMGPTPLISIDEMCRKVRAAIRARHDPDFQVIVRSDVFGSVATGTVPREELIGQICERSNAYVEAGADLVFVYAQTRDELEHFAHQIRAPLVGLMGFIAPLTMADFTELGVKIVICPLPVMTVAARAISQMLATLVGTGKWEAIEGMLMPFGELKELLDLDRYSSLIAEIAQDHTPVTTPVS